LQSSATDSRGIPVSNIEITAENDAPVTQRLQGFVRNMPLGQISEDHPDFVSEISKDESHYIGNGTKNDENEQSHKDI
jgi:hypothetical protein